jgi:gamma-glutamyltranspeptidase/glutathione hydrolase
VSSEIRTTTAALATSHPQAAQAGADLFRAGGNAIDASVAAVVTLCICSPASVGLAGYGGTMVAWIAKQKKVVAIDFDSRCPLNWKPEDFQTPEDRRFSWKAVTVPGVVAGLDLALKTFGTKSWADISQHALKLAEEGFEIDKKFRRQLDDWRGRTDEISLRSYFGEAGIPEPKTIWIQKKHAAILRKIVEQGPGAMYHGEIPREICRQVQAQGGVLSEEDFAQYAASIEQPLRISYRSHEVYSPPPPCGAITSLQILKTLEQFDVRNLPRDGADYLHTLAEAIKLAWGDREKYLGDPCMVDVPIEKLLSEAHARSQAEKIRRGGVANVTSKADSGQHTVNVVAADAEGNLVSLTATQGFLFGSQRIVEGMGLVLGHGMSRFDYEPGHPNSPQPGKRMHHNMSPMMILKNGAPRWAFGMPGGTKIVNVTAQLAMNFIDWNMSPSQSIFAPRIHSEGADPIMISATIDKQIVEELKAMGHEVRREQTIGGPANAIQMQGREIIAASGNGEEAIGIKEGTETQRHEGTKGKTEDS